MWPTSLNNLAGLYDAQGEYELAEPLYKESLALRKSLLGDRHPAVATSLNNLAGLYYAQGEYELAEPLYKESLALYKSLFGAIAPSSCGNEPEQLSLALLRSGEYELANRCTKSHWRCSSRCWAIAIQLWQRA